MFLAQGLTLFMGRKKRDKISAILESIADIDLEYANLKLFLKRMDATPIPQPTQEEMAMLNRVHATIARIGVLNQAV